MIVLVIVQPKRREGKGTHQQGEERRVPLSIVARRCIFEFEFFFFRGAVGISFVAVWSRK
jgi:hypothetical protein